MSRQVDLGQIVPNIQIGTTTTGSPSTPASVVNVGTDLNPIFNFTIPKGDPGAIKMQIVNVLPETGEEDTIYLVPNTDPETQNNYDEYVYINGQWEKLGGVQVEVDLTDYVKNTDYATSTKSGVIKYGYGAYVSGSNGYIMCPVRTYTQYQTDNDQNFIGKGTLENVITGKGLVNNTSYAGSTGGVIKTSSEIGTYTSDDGILKCRAVSYQEYNDTFSTYGFISQGTLENVLTARIGDINSVLDAINGESV